MTSFNIDNNQARYQIRAYQPGQILVNEKLLTQSIIISANQLIEDWSPEQASEITEANLAQAIALQPSILIIGTGTIQTFISLEVYGNLLNQGIGVEIMNTAAACRTYNVLTAENRNVVAALVLK